MNKWSVLKSDSNTSQASTTLGSIYQEQFVRRLTGRTGALTKRLLSAALLLPLAACGASGGAASSDTSQPATVVGDTTTSTAAVVGMVDRSGATSSTDTADSGTVGTTSTGVKGGATNIITPSPTPVSVTNPITPVAAPVTSPTPVTPPVTTPVVTPPVMTPTPVSSVTKKSISAYVSCGTATDDTAGAVKAFAAAKNNAFTLVVDCPVHLKSGLAIDKSIFIDNGTTVEFTGAGKIYVDNMFHPAFVIADSTNITLTNWNVEWDGIVPIDPNVGGYELNGAFVTSPGVGQPAASFNDLTLLKWLATNRGLVFDNTQGYIKPIWTGAADLMAVFYLTGNSSNVAFTGLKLSVPAGVTGDHYLPMGVAFTPNWKANQTVNGKSTQTVAFAAVPHDISFSGVDFDGTLMGWQGNVRNAMFENVTSHRYGDVQDAKGGTTGGIGKWFPPPHLFYLNYVYTGDPGLFNTNIHISNVTDLGIRTGVARDKGGSDSVSGYALSLKLGCTECSVDTYTSNRPDGFMDLLPSDNFTVTNIKATFDSSFINNAFPAALRFPGVLYTRITLENVAFTDTAAVSIKGPIANAGYASNEAIVFNNVSVTIKNWAGDNIPVPQIAGTTNNINIAYTLTAQSMKAAFVIKSTVTSTLSASPINVLSGGSTKLIWSSKAASGCTATGAWVGALSTSGNKTVVIGAAGNNDFKLNCQNSAAASSSSLMVMSQ
jgi:hypothetical protein